MTEDSLPELLTAEVLDELIAKHRCYWPRLGPWTTPSDRSRARWFRDRWIPVAVYERGAWSLADSAIDNVLDVDRLAAKTLATFDRSPGAKSFRVGGYELVEGCFQRLPNDWQSTSLGMVPRGALELMSEVLRLRWLDRVLS